MKEIPLVFIVCVFFSCSSADEEYPFDQSPYIEIENLEFHDTPTSDTMKLTFILWDKEGDIGFRDSDFGFPYHLYNSIVDQNNELVTINNELAPPYYQVPTDIALDRESGQYGYYFDLMNKSPISDQIGWTSDFSCDRHFIRYEDTSIGSSPIDTLLGQENEFVWNLRLSILDENGTELDFNKIFANPSCDLGKFHARIFDLSGVPSIYPVDFSVFKVQRINDFAWRIQYNMLSQVWRLALLEGRFEFTLDVNDRALNKSNLESTGLFTLEEITEQ